jgi:hypothetical protein
MSNNAAPEQVPLSTIFSSDMYKFGCLLIVILLSVAVAVCRLLLHNRRIYLLSFRRCLIPGDVFGDAQQDYESQD